MPFTKAQKRHFARSKARANRNLQLSLVQLQPRPKCDDCKYQHNLLWTPCDKHWPLLTDVEIMIIGYCPHCDRSLIGWSGGKDCKDPSVCPCWLLENKDRQLIDRPGNGDVLHILDRGRTRMHLFSDMCYLDKISNGFASRRINLTTTGAFVHTEYGCDEIGIGLSGYEGPADQDNQRQIDNDREDYMIDSLNQDFQDAARNSLRAGRDFSFADFVRSNPSARNSLLGIYESLWDKLMD